MPGSGKIRKQTSLTPQLLREEVRGHGRESGENGGQEHAHVADVDGDVQKAEGPVDESRREHESRVHRPSHYAAQWVPRSLVEPVQKVVVAVLHHIVRGAVVEPGIELVDDALEANDGEEPGAEAGDTGQSQHRHADQLLPPQYLQGTGSFPTSRLRGHSHGKVSATTLRVRGRRLQCVCRRWWERRRVVLEGTATALPSLSFSRNQLLSLSPLSSPST